MVTDRHLGSIDDGCKTESRVKGEAMLGLHGANQKTEMEKIAQITQDKIVCTYELAPNHLL